MTTNPSPHDPAGAGEARYGEQRRIIGLAEPLPCAILRDGALCGHDATVAHAWPLRAYGQWPTPGLWALQPICRACVQEMMAVYADKQPFPGKHEQ